MSFSVPPWGGQEQRGFNTRVSHTGRSPRERQEGAQHTREEAAQWTSVQLRKFPSCHSFRLFSPLLFTSSRCPFFPPLHFKFKLVFASVGLSDKCQLICILLLLPFFPKCGNAWLSSAETSAHERNIFLVLNNRHCARS